ncbi:MAG: PilZ domain-containing protein [Alphaproteobacteria bacterium]|jgi:hypothetical protein|nr:PilZ domain-containing protein [Alphaproteobacteria bacterium]MBU0801984.1 PilZ domain-containing protein [Alphaproteobacteria bacterium]MBU0872409.1 PilZ domain-containing protein [Alphaproteobacteria bacterium]MBU1399483.1 PilZ domain-containing protein [Alphaproteobacteria bacterium]MBU1589869.1 PilZ domain-containing protein [Alphaproteobacteria bacterium]
MSKPTSDRRHRNRVIKGGAILSGITNSAISCTIRNMHSEGAELRVDPEARIPSEFLLYVALDGVAYRAHLRWRTLDRCGVEFTGTEPKPSWHYG